jgi:transcriptional regulator with PAS, ATPase and Fis domain
VLEKVLEKQKLTRDAEQLKERVRQRYRFEAIVGESPALQSCLRRDQAGRADQGEHPLAG